jgi:hypothetical protein
MIVVSHMIRGLAVILGPVLSPTAMLAWAAFCRKKSGVEAQ